MSATTEKKLTGAAAKAHEAKVAREQGKAPAEPKAAKDVAPDADKSIRRPRDGETITQLPPGHTDDTGESLIQPGESHNDAEKRLHMALTKDGRPAGPQGAKAERPAPDPSEFGLRPGESHNDAEKRLHMALDKDGQPLS